MVPPIDRPPRRSAAAVARVAAVRHSAAGTQAPTSGTRKYAAIPPAMSPAMPLRLPIRPLR